MARIPEPSFSKEINIVTGRQGQPHITAAQAGRRIAGIVGKEKYILNCGKKGFEFSLNRDSSTQITIGSGDAIICGRHVTMSEPTTLSIKPGTQGMKRNILVCLRVEIADGAVATDRASIIAIDGDETSGDPKDPPIWTGSLLSGDTIVDMPLWRIPVNGLILERGVWLGVPWLSTISELKSTIKSDAKAELNRIKNEIADAKSKVASLKEKTHSKVTVSTIWKDLEYQKNGYVYDLRRSLGIKIEKSYAVRRGIENIIKITLIPVSSLTKSMLEEKKIFPFYVDSERKYSSRGEAIVFSNRSDTMCDVEFRVDLPYPMRTTTYEIAGDWGYIDNVTVREIIREDSFKQDILGERKQLGNLNISCTKEKSYIDFTIEGRYVSGFLEHSFDPARHRYEPASLTIREV